MRGMAREYAAGNARGPGWREFAGTLCSCSAIPSSLIVKRKCPHHGDIEIDPERASKTSGSQQFDDGTYDHRAGSGL